MERRRARSWAAALLAWSVLTSACGPVVSLDPPDIGRVQRRPPEQSYVLDAEGNRLAVLRQEFRERISLDQVPRHLIDAIVAAEDRRFWIHRGVDARAIARAALANAATGEPQQGGSTITQQLVKNLYLPDAPRTLETKAREALLARDLERQLSKRAILEEYLNTVYFGNGAYGVHAGAYTYWRKPVAELDLAEAALLAGLIRAPNSLDPTAHPDAARNRRDQVLSAMQAQALASPDAVAAARAEPVRVRSRPPAPAAQQRHWVDFVVRTLLQEESFGDDEGDRAQRLYGGGLRIHTTLQPDRQAEAEVAVRRFFDDPGDPEVALVAIDPATGAIVASVGGRDYAASQFDLATQGRRQPGSAFKTFVLTAAVAAGYRPETRVNGNQGLLRLPGGGRWRVRNFDRVSYGWITLAEATRASVNGAYARLVLDVGVDRTIAAARALGITAPLNDDPAIALGGIQRGVTPFEMAASYATLANLGMRAPVSPIDRIENARGEVVWRPDRTPRQVVDAGVAWLVTQMLRTAVEDGTGARARLPGWDVAGKTGTVQDYTDAWFVGYTTELTAAVWLGYPDARVPLRDVGGERFVTGGSWPARIWREFMQAALAGRRPARFTLPEAQLVEVEIDPKTGLLAAPWCPGERQLLPRVLVPQATCPSPPPAPPPPPAPGPTAAEPGPCPPTPAPTPAANQRSCPPASTAAGPSPAPSPSPSPTPTTTASPSPAGSATASTVPRPPPSSPSRSATGTRGGAR